MAGNDNLKGKGFHERTVEEQRKIATAGGKASGEARRKKKAMKEQMKILLSLDVQPPKLRAQMEKLGICAEDMDNQMALITALYAEALKGKVGAFKAIQSLIGEDKEENAKIKEYKAKTENLKADTAKLKGEDIGPEAPDDGFMEALKGKVDDIWQDE